MKAADLLVSTREGSLAELIDKHNALVRHIFANADAAIAIIDDWSPLPSDDAVIKYFKGAPLRTDRPTLPEIRFAHILLIGWGYRCMCVFPKPKQPYADIFICTSCNKPYQEPLRDE